MGKGIKAVRAASGLGIVAVLTLFPIIVHAAVVDPPDTLEILTARVAHNVVEDGDFVVFFHSNIHYDGYEPADAADELFIFRFMSVNGTSELGATTPYPYYTANAGYGAGYDQGIGCFYFAAADAPTWEQEYQIRIIGNPAAFEELPDESFTLSTGGWFSSSDFCTSDNQDDNQAFLGSYLLTVATRLEINWDADLLDQTDAGTVLNTAGDDYFTNAIPGLRVMCPDIFWVRTLPTDYEDRDWGTEQADTYKERYDDTSFGRSLDSVGGLFGLDGGIIFGGCFLIGAVACIGVSQWKLRTTDPGMLAATIVLLCGVVMGGVPMAMKAILGLVAALFIGYLLFFRSS